MAQKARASVDMYGELAAAFLQELGARVQKGKTPSKADLGRTLIAEALQARGHEVDLPQTTWGGARDRPTTEDEAHAIAGTA